MIITKDIHVVDGQNTGLSSTYLKRARQLVKKGRAAWLDESTICLTQPEEDINSMKALAKEEPVLVEAVIEPEIKTEAKPEAKAAKETIAAAQPQAQPQAEPQSEHVEDRAIRDLAKRRLSTKRSLLGQALDYLFIVVVVLLLANFSYSDAMVLAFFFCAFWGLRLLYRIVKFMEPSLKGGIGAYLQKRKEQQLETEYNRLKKMGTEYVTNELSR